MSELRRAVALAAVGIASCSHGAPVRRPGEPRVVLAPAGAAEATVVVEVARTPAELQRGLMYRERLDPGRGMLFLFPRPERLTFWMHNTYVPLDMIFIGSDHRVVGVVENATPLTDDPRAVDGISQYVLEVPAGWAAAHRIAPQTPVRFLDID